MNEYIMSDLYRCYGKKNFMTLCRGLIEDPGFNYMFWLRMCQRGGILKLIALPIHKWKRTFGKINIGYKCHNATIVGNPARIVNMNQPGRFIKNRWIN